MFVGLEVFITTVRVRCTLKTAKLIPGLRIDLSYEERLNECGLITLDMRRLRGDQKEV